MLLTRLVSIPTLTLLLATQAFAGGQEIARPTISGGPAAPVPGDYVIGVEDVLGVVFWREQDRNLTTDVVVRPDGKIPVPMLNDVNAAGLTAEQLAATVQQAASKFIRDAAVTVVVRAIHSRRIFVVGEVSKPGAVELGSELNVLQAIAGAGGFLEHAKRSEVVIVRSEGGRERRFKFNYKDVVAGKKLDQNIKLVPGDTVLVR